MNIKKMASGVVFVAIVGASAAYADGFVDPVTGNNSGARAAWEIEYESANGSGAAGSEVKTGGVHVGEPIYESGSSDGEIATKTVTTTETVTRIPRPPVEKRVCEVTDTCDRLDTLRLIDEMQERMAVLDAEKRLAEARGAKNKALCDEAKACVGVIGMDSPVNQPATTNASVASIYGAVSSGFIADIIVNGSRVSVSEGDDTPDGAKVVEITPNSVVVRLRGSGANVRLPFAGSMTGQ